MKSGGKMVHLRVFEAVLAAAVALSAAPLFGGELTLADNGVTEYQVTSPETPSPMEADAIADLKNLLKEITGADFAAGAGKKHHIHVGVPAPSDRKPLKENERRIASEGGDIYLYGEGKYGNVNAVYDFLRDVLGCRWYNVTGDRKIPRHRKLVVSELRSSLVPSIPYITADRVASLPEWRDFARRHGLLALTDVNIGTYGAHAGQRIIPSGLVPFGKRVGNTPSGLKYFRNKAYFRDHPEYFSLGADGKRGIRTHLCYSNPQMRDEYERNLEIMLKAERYRDDEVRLIGIGQDDNRGQFCHCKECEALKTKWKHDAGPYYDFLMDMSKRFAKTHPKLLLCFLAYNQTQEPSPVMKHLPGNLLPSYAPLARADFSKPLDSVSNRREAELFTEWSKLADKMHWWAYPTPYCRPAGTYTVIANIHRIAENYRFAYRNKTWMAYNQFGAGAYDAVGFNDLRLYLLCELCRRIDADEAAIVCEYMENCYGPAAPLMLEHLAELERLELENPQFLRWNMDVLAQRYITGANLVRWQRRFERMEKLAGVTPRDLLNIRRARYVIDLALIAKWPYLTEEEKRAVGDLETVVTRAESTIAAHSTDLFKSWRRSAPKRYATELKNRIEAYHRALDPYVARARGGKALPAEFSGRKVYRILHNLYKLGLTRDPDAPFGWCAPHQYTTRDWFCMRTFDARRESDWMRIQPPLPFDQARVRSVPDDGKYRYYHLGAMTIAPDAQIAYAKSMSSFHLQELYDPQRPNRLFDFYVMLAVVPGRKQLKLGELLVIPRNEDAKAGEESQRATDETINTVI